jgi:hypothetical protein
MKIETAILLAELDALDHDLPDDRWDLHHWKGWRAGLLRAIEIVASLGEHLNHNLTTEEVKKIVEDKGL